ncbi:hypothetical protein [Spiroplasma phoeniceum]|uniref:Uncharacterized protein n=1 Tax=Spiroplasma phoeniceum P40 TaxID=1276259 RepID=A0A345DN57_9MOLU|nr:hypothetical protein [Spiroplasma phoeniceum]AXF95645.1 hypothetical protein SDAV_00654 [Spiroplasma phoeniceum P40]
MQKVNQININQFNKSNIGSLTKPWYSDVPDLTKKADVIAEMNTGLIKAIQKINAGLTTSDYIVTILDFSHLIFNDRDEGDFSKDVELSYSLNGTNWLTGETTGMEITVPAATKKTKNKK